MSRRGRIEQTRPAECAFCHAKKELRPYGPKGESICFSCAMQDEAMTERRFRQHVFGEGFDA